MSERPDRRDRRRAVMNDARRSVERALAVAEVAEDLATAAEAVLAAEAEAAGRPDLAALRDALTRYRGISRTAG